MGEFVGRITSQSLLDGTGSWLDDEAKYDHTVFLQNYRNFNSPLVTRFSHYFLSNRGQAVSNAFLSALWYPSRTKWLTFEAPYGRGTIYNLTSNYWRTASSTILDHLFSDYNDNFDLATIAYSPVLVTPPEGAFPFVTDIQLSTASQTNISVVGAEIVTFTVTFNRNMSVLIQPQVTFGPDAPITDYTVHPVNGGWQNARTWIGR
jgi:hypothetical protein